VYMSYLQTKSTRHVRIHTLYRQRRLNYSHFLPVVQNHFKQPWDQTAIGEEVPTGVTQQPQTFYHPRLVNSAEGVVKKLGFSGYIVTPVP
jgi:hypothetical protein